jgi:branched-chain amino acid aminotransferase
VHQVRVSRTGDPKAEGLNSYMMPPSFADRDGFIWFDGAFVPWRGAHTHVLTHALHYGSAVFEGERVYQSAVFKLQLHTLRLIRSAQLLEFEIPFSVEQLAAATRELVEVNNISDGYVRTVAWRGPEVMGIATQGSAIHVAIACWPWPSYWQLDRKVKGLRLEIAQWRRPAPDTAPTASKAAGLYIIASLSKDRAVRNGNDDALMLDYRGLVAEATGANICFLRGKELHTPEPDCFLDGITRQAVEDLASRRGYDVHRRAIRPTELTTFEEAFLCGTAAEIAPIGAIGDVRYEIASSSRTFIADFADLTASATE